MILCFSVQHNIDCFVFFKFIANLIFLYYFSRDKAVKCSEINLFQIVFITEKVSFI